MSTYGVVEIISQNYNIKSEQCVKSIDCIQNNAKLILYKKAFPHDSFGVKIYLGGNYHDNYHNYYSKMEVDW